MVQLSQESRLTFETVEPFAIARELYWQNLDGNVAAKLRIARPVDLAIPPWPMDSTIS